MRPVITTFITIACHIAVFFLFSPACAEKQAADMVQENQPIDLNTPIYQDLFKELEQKHHFLHTELLQLFSDLTINRKVLRLMDKQWGKPLPWYKYKKRFITRSLIAKGKQYLRQHHQLLTDIEQKFSVNKEAVVAIWAIETRYGSNCGNFNMLRSLNTLFTAYPRRSDFFRQELIHYLLLCRKNGLNPQTVLGSYAGAFGQAQFMPSSYRKYAVDYDGNQQADLLNSTPDIFASIANYLKTFGWVLNTPTFIDIGPELKSAAAIAASIKGWKGKCNWQSVAQSQGITLPAPPNNSELTIACLQLSDREENKKRCIAGYPNYQAILHYNHSVKYAMVVSELAEAFRR